MTELNKEQTKEIREITLTECLKKRYHHFKYNGTYYSIIGVSNIGGSRRYDCYSFSAGVIIRNVAGEKLVIPIEREEAIRAYEAR